LVLFSGIVSFALGGDRERLGREDFENLDRWVATEFQRKNGYSATWTGPKCRHCYLLRDLPDVKRWMEGSPWSTLLNNRKSNSESFADFLFYAVFEGSWQGSVGVGPRPVTPASVVLFGHIVQDDMKITVSPQIFRELGNFVANQYKKKYGRMPTWTGKRCLHCFQCAEVNEVKDWVSAFLAKLPPHQYRA
jgi:hypothetical protein